jgi:hypothetical protein
MLKKTRNLLMAVLAMAAVTIVGCSDDDDNGLNSQPTSRVMVVHASPDAPGVDILVDGSTAVSGLLFAQSTGYVPLNAGDRLVKVRAVPTGDTVISATLPLLAGRDYTVFAINSVANIEALVLEDDLSTPAAGKAHVRFVHLSPNAPAVDVAVTGGGVLFGDATFREVQGFAPVDAGTYNLEVRLAGQSTVVLPLPGITLSAGTIYTVYARGFVGGTGSQALGAEIIVNN